MSMWQDLQMLLAFVALVLVISIALLKAWSIVLDYKIRSQRREQEMLTDMLMRRAIHDVMRGYRNQEAERR